MPNPDGTMTETERRALLTKAGPAGGFVASTKVPYDPTLSPAQNQLNQENANIASGNMLGGDAAHNVRGQDAIHGNLSSAEAAAKHERDYALGANNSPEAAAMIGQALATGDKYSAQFGADAAHAGLQSTAAGNRGLGIYGGDTSQYNAALANAQHDRGMQTGAYGQLMAFANQGPGPSAAQAQLQGATDANTQNALALARSGRGMGGGAAALRGAINQNALTQQASNNQLAALRAQENTAYQGQRLQALGGAGTIAGQTVQMDQGTAAAGLAGAQYSTNLALQGTQLNDASSQAWAAQRQAAQQQGLAAEMGAQTQGLNINSTALTGRENADAASTQQYAVKNGMALNASIADANRTQAYVGAGLSTAGTVLGAVSDERFKTNILPLSGGTVAPLPSQSGGSVMATPAAQGSDAQRADDQKKAMGSTVGKVGGGAIGAAVAGPIGGVVGSVIGGALGKALSDVRNKTNLRSLSGEDDGSGREYAVRDPHNPSQFISSYQSISDASHQAHGVPLSRPTYDGPKRALDTANPYQAGAPRQLDQANPYEQLQALAQKYGAAGVAEQPKAVAQYAESKPTEKALQRFSRDTSHPILSSGDALLADSARSAPPSMYEYKDKRDGAGVYTGPMAQDLARHPVTQGAVGEDPATGKLYVDGARASMVGLAQNHSQQKQLDTLDAKIAELQGLLKRKPGDERATSFPTSTGGL